MFGTIAYLPLLVQNLRAGGPFKVGVVMMTMSLGWSGASFLTGRAVHRAGENWMVRIGIPLMLAGFMLGVFTTQDAPLLQLIAMALLGGVGMGMQTPALLLAVQHSVEPRHIGVATSAQMLSRTIGGAVGVSVAGAAVSALMGRALEGLARRTGTGADGSPQELLGREAQALLPPGDLELVRSAFVDSIHAVFLIAVAVLTVSMLLTTLLPPSSLHRSGEDHHPEGGNA
jgi:MFS family permease